MERIKYNQKLKDAPLPCEWFELMGGTGTGGYAHKSSVSMSFSNVALIES